MPGGKNYEVASDQKVWREIYQFIAGELSLVHEVDAVFSARTGNVLNLWTVVNSADSELRRRVYKREQRIIDEFPDLEFDFSILTRRDRDISAFTRQAGLEIAFQRNRN